MIRTFVAVRVGVLPELQAVLKSLAGLRWPIVAVSPDNLHVTLKFLGETPVARRDDVSRCLAQAVAGQPPLNVRVQGLGAFPTPDRPSVIWTGLLDAEPLVALAERLETLLEPLGFARDSRPFHAHVTLARVKGRPPRELFELLRRHAATGFGSIEIRSVEFMQSDRQREGARYSTLASCPLA
jgi:2'-5' RNA ligase